METDAGPTGVLSKDGELLFLESPEPNPLLERRLAEEVCG